MTVEGIMNRILKKIRTGILAAGFISVSAFAMAQNVLSVPGLGTIPLPHDMQLVDGKGSSVEKMFIENTQRPDFGESSQAAFMEIVAIPPGMDLFAEKGTHPFNRAHLYQLQMKKPQGQYTAGVFVVSGNGEELFPDSRVRAFWDKAFSEGSDRPTSLFGLPKIQLSEYQSIFDRFLASRKGNKMKIKVMSFAPWHAYKNADGTYRWQQEAKAVVTDYRGLSFPVWIYSAFFREGDQYFLIYLEGSHMAGAELDEPWLASLYQLKRGDGV